MSRFLHRIISSAHSPGGSVHPVLDSVYSRPALQSVPQDLPDELAGTAAPNTSRPGFGPANRGRRVPGAEPTGIAVDAATGAEAPDLDPASIASSRGTTDPARDVADALSGRDGRGLANSIAPPSNSPGSNTQVSAIAATTGAQAARPATAQEDSASSPSFRRVVGARHEAAAEASAQTPGRYKPLMPESAPTAMRAGTSSPAVSPPTVGVRHAGATDSDRNFARPARSSQREADDIQIHIGRIEVTAMAPAPERPAAAPRRKSPSLDDYLKRGRGRAE
jgi:hypothetical protein